MDLSTIMVMNEFLWNARESKIIIKIKAQPVKIY
jgi:hypothetical protein